ncbi:MAG: DNA-processing protein DprA, partial [Mesonia sp.]
NWDIENKEKQQAQLFVDLSPQEELVLENLQKSGKAEMDEIAISCNMPTFKLNPILLSLELKGLVRPLPGKQFETI